MSEIPIPHRIGSKAPCVIDLYEADFEALPNGDVRAELRIQYFVYDEPKSDGFKFVGSLPIVDAEVTDGEGKPLRWKREEHRETLIRFFFPRPLQNAAATVVMRFRIKGALEGANENRFSADWVGNFRIPVIKSAYRFRLPPGHKVDSLTISPRGTWQDKGRVVAEVAQEPHRATSFSARFQPPLVRAAVRPPVSPRTSGRGGLSAGLTVLLALLMAALAVVCVSSSKGGCSGGSSGGSSCSSYSSCSSCGGGGCGGGGCGGCGGGG